MPPYPSLGRGIRGRGRGRGRPSRIADNRSARGGGSTSATPSASFSQTLQFITSIKLQEVEKQRVAYEAHATQQLIDASAASNDLHTKVSILLKAVQSWSGSGALTPGQDIGGKLDLANLETWLLQASKDPSFSPTILENWANTLETHIHHSGTRFECAKLFGNLLSEWLTSGDSVIAKPTGAAESKETFEFEALGRKEMLEQKEKLSSIIFEPKTTNLAALETYLDDLFAGEEAKNILNNVREKLTNFCYEIQRLVITADDIQWTIKSVLASSLMNEEQRLALQEFTQNSLVLEEVASVLNMRLGSLASWKWPASGVVIEMRRHLNGKYRAFTDPEILDALFLEYLGVRFQVEFKAAFRSIFQSNSWKSGFQPLTKSQNSRRTLFLNREGSGIEGRRQELRQSKFVVGQLADNPSSTAQYETGDEPNVGAVKSGGSIKEELLHLMTTECYLNKTLHGHHTVLRTDLEWFGPSLPHGSIMILLAFFGITQPWLDFFLVFLRSPLRFKGDPEDELRTRECGTPISYSLSALFGEIILFGMDFAVNQKADGLFLYRMHDDLWLWDSQPGKCVAAWKEMNKYASLVGMTFNVTKTGSACVGDVIHSDLPPGDIRWGFLKFDSDKARFIIDQEDVDKHIIELRRQLAATKSVFGWVNAYNKYMAFFARNFGGRPAACFGWAHVDDVIDTMARIQRELFPTPAGGAITHLRAIIEQRFGFLDLPEGYFYFPISSGGLEIRNPLIEILAMRGSVLEEPEREFFKEMERDKETYQTLKANWDASPQSSSYISEPLSFMSFEEYVSQRETRLNSWLTVYDEMQRVAEPSHVNLTPAMGAVGRTRWYSMDYYEKWVVSLYGEELIKRFGSLEIVDPNLIPLGMVQLFRSSRLKWDQ